MTPSRPTIRLTSPVDVLAAVPFLFGFHPTDSFVLLGLAGKQLAMHARCDLFEVGAPVRELQRFGREFVDLLRRAGADSVVLVGYGSQERVDPVMGAVHQALTRRRIKSADRLRVHEGRFWSYSCRSRTCCPPEGTPYDVDTSSVGAEAVFAGLSVEPDREAVLRSLDPPTGVALEAIELASGRARDRLAGFFASGGDTAKACDVGAAAIDEAIKRYAARQHLDDDELSWLGVLLTLIPVRDVAWERIDADDRIDAVPCRQLLTDLVRRGDPALAAPPAMLLAYLLWRLGDGIRAGVAVDRALAADPGYTAGKLMAEVLDRAIPPWADESGGSDAEPATASKASGR